METTAGEDGIRLILDVLPDREPIAGSIQMPGRPQRPFSGWIDLVAAVEEAVKAPAEAPTEQPERR